MLRRLVSGFTWVMAAVGLIQLSGCTLIGLGFGEAVDARRPEQRSIPGWMIATVKPGTTLAIILRDSSRVSGIYTGITPVSAAEYAERYAVYRAQHSDGQQLPTLGDQITVTRRADWRLPSKKVEGEFVGFDYRQGSPSPMIVLQGSAKQSSKIKLYTVDLNMMDTLVDNHGTAMDTATIRRVISRGQLPFLSAMVIEHERGKTVVAIDQVAQIVAPVKKQGKQTGATIGTIVDGIGILVIIVLYIISAFPDIDLSFPN